jgi:ABC-type phosphate/phosphonate transport system substrate-binding protein
MMKTLIAVGLVCSSAVSFAGPKDFVVERSGVGGSTEEAVPYLAAFLRYAESKLGWPANSANAQFFAEADPALAYITEKQPAFGMLDPELWLTRRTKDDLEVIATVEGKSGAADHYSVVVKDPAFKTLADLKGKKLSSNHLQSPMFVSKVAFDGKIDISKHFVLQPTASPLKGLKAVDRGEADATLLDDAQLANMKSLPFAADLRVIFTSAALPPMPMVVFKKNSTPKDIAAVKQMLLGMCADPAGAKVCTSLQIGKFAPPNKMAYDQATKRYDK